MIPTQGFWTLVVGLVGTLIPLAIQWIALAQTPQHEFACTRCNRNVPIGSARCPACNAPVLHADQKL